jgi:hypothetical protein
LKRSWVFLFVAIIIILLLFIPYIQASKTEKGQQLFSYVAITNGPLGDLSQHFEATPEKSSDIKVTITGDADNTAVIVFESHDWILNVEMGGSTLSTGVYNVTHYTYDPPATTNRMEEKYTSLLSILNLNYTDKSTGLSEITTKRLVSETASGEFSFSTYLQDIKNMNVPIVNSYSFDKVEIVNKLTNATETGFTYDAKKGLYAQDISAQISFELNYSVSKITYVSVFSSEELYFIKAAFTSAIVTALVGALVSYYKQTKKTEELPPPPPPPPV